MVPRGTTVSLGALGALAALAWAGRAGAEGRPTPFDELGPNLGAAFWGTGLVLQGAAVGATAVMAEGGVDHAARVGVQRNLAWPAYGQAAVWAGYVAPTVVAPGIYVVGLVVGDDELAGAGAAAVQALVLTTGETFALKWITGRPYPLHGGDPAAADRLEHPEYAREFSFWPPTRSRGVSWPSGHTSASVSVAAALSGYYPDKLWVPLVSYPLAAAIAGGMLSGDHHWASDVVAGALIGQAVGWASGAGLHRARAKGRLSGSAWGLVPTATGLMAWGNF